MIGCKPFFPLSKQDWENFHEEVESVSSSAMIGCKPFFPLSKQDWENFHEEVESVSQRTLQTS